MGAPKQKYMRHPICSGCTAVLPFHWKRQDQIINLFHQTPRKEPLMRKKLSFLGLSLLWLCCINLLALAQATASATLEGTVTDKNLAVIRGATETVENKATGQARSVTTNESGNYRFELLPAGLYDIKVSA